MFSSSQPPIINAQVNECRWSHESNYTQYYWKKIFKYKCVTEALMHIIIHMAYIHMSNKIIISYYVCVSPCKEMITAENLANFWALMKASKWWTKKYTTAECAELSVPVWRLAVKKRMATRRGSHYLCIQI